MPVRRAAAVIGAAGFLGGALAARLADIGVTTETFTRARPFVDSRGSLRGRWDAIDTVYWLAGSIRPATADGLSAAGPTDLDTLRSLLDAIRRDRPDVRLVAASSGGTVYDSRWPPPYDEESVVCPANAYGAAMRQVEELVSTARDFVVLRIANAYGPGQRPRRGQGVVAHWMSDIAAGREVKVIGSEQVARDYVYIDDVVDAFLRVHLRSGPVPTVVNIGSGRPTTLGQLLALVEEVVAPSDVSVRREASRSFDAQSTWLDIRRAASGLDWRPTIGLRDGLSRTWTRLNTEAAQMPGGAEKQ